MSIGNDSRKFGLPQRTNAERARNRCDASAVGVRNFRRRDNVQLDHDGIASVASKDAETLFAPFPTRSEPGEYAPTDRPDQCHDPVAGEFIKQTGHCERLPVAESLLSAEASGSCQSLVATAISSRTQNPAGRINLETSS